MPAAAVAAAATIVASKIASNSNKHSVDAQTKTNTAALDYEKQRQAEKRQRYDAAYKDYRGRYDSWLKQYFGQETPASEPAAAPGQVRASTSGYRPPGGDTLGDMMGKPNPVVPSTTAAVTPPLVPEMTTAPGDVPSVKMQRQTGTLADLGGFANPADFKRYGLRRRDAAV